MGRLEIETRSELVQLLQQQSNVDGAVLQNLDLRGLEQELRQARPKDNVLLGCRFDPKTIELFQAPLVFPSMRNLPFKPYRSMLYSPEELMGDYRVGQPGSYEETVDGKTYAMYVAQEKATTTDVMVMLARRLHDHAISDALREFMASRRVVAIMGGHSMRRDSVMYAQVAELSRELTRRGYLLASGGGPGAMEATHLGSWFASRNDVDLQDAIKILAPAPLYDPVGPWLEAAFTVFHRYPNHNREQTPSLGIPTWLYGHEPPTCFATHIAKYFANSVREEGLLAIAKHGVVFAPGNEGTIQEVFQDAAQNRYKTFEMASPMIFLDTNYWTVEKPIYPVLKKVAAGKQYDRLISLVDSTDQVVSKIEEFAAAH